MAKKDHPKKALVGKPKSLKVAMSGVQTGTDFARLMSALMSDLIEGRMAPGVSNAVCNAAGKLLKVVELQYRYGGRQTGDAKTGLLLVEPPTATVSVQ